MSDHSLPQRLQSLAKLGEYILAKPELLAAYVQRSAHHNGWFTVENQWRMLEAIAEDYLSLDKLQAWVEPYAAKLPVEEKTVGLVLAGNIPLVGFHDWLSVMVAGHTAEVKLSDKDPYLLPHLVGQLEKIDTLFSGRTRFVERLSNFEAVIATGSNNTTRYFRQYFSRVPHVIRGNRTSVAVLHGHETPEMLRGLAEDIFAYFGLGCRSVGKIYVPAGYDFEPLLAILHEFKDLARNTKWKNNFDYNYALLTINKEAFLMTGSMLLYEAKAFHSRLATLHYEYYQDLADVAIDLNAHREELQAIVSGFEVPGTQVVAPGEGQRPGLADYADGVDVLEFLVGV
jgi:hypothetical protein